MQSSKKTIATKLLFISTTIIILFSLTSCSLCDHQYETVFFKNTDGGIAEPIIACIHCGDNESGYDIYNSQTEITKNHWGGLHNRTTTYKNKKNIVFLNPKIYNDPNYLYKFVITSTVDEIVFVGEDGYEINQIMIVVRERSNDLIIDFSNVMIESFTKVLISQECYAGITIRTHGNNNSLRTRNAADGRNGDNGYDASDVIYVLGDITFIAYSKITVAAGNGGNGENGGNGGNGGDAIVSKRAVSVLGDTDLADFRGGVGGRGAIKGCDGLGIRCPDD